MQVKGGLGKYGLTGQSLGHLARESDRQVVMAGVRVCDRDRQPGSGDAFNRRKELLLDQR